VEFDPAHVHALPKSHLAWSDFWLARKSIACLRAILSENLCR